MLNRLLFKKHLDEDEVLIRVVHKHWLLGLKSLFWPTLWFALAWGLVALSQTKAMLTVGSLLSVVFLVWWLRNFFDYYLDAWIITNEGILDIAWHGWFHRESSRILYSDLQGVSYEIQGVWATMLRFGTVSVEKISTGSEVSLEYVSRPKRIESLILKNMEKYMHSKNLKDSKQVQELLSTLIAERLQMKDLSSDEEDDDE